MVQLVLRALIGLATATKMTELLAAAKLPPGQEIKKWVLALSDEEMNQLISESTLAPIGFQRGKMGAML